MSTQSLFDAQGHEIGCNLGRMSVDEILPGPQVRARAPGSTGVPAAPGGSL